MKKISVLIANYNNGKYFEECFRSLVNQTYENWEAIIVDDTSTDDSVNIIKTIIKDDPRFKLYENPENKGCGFTKRKCADLATGDYCAYLDPDDALFPNAIERSLSEFETNSNIIATYSQLTFCDQDLNPQKVYSEIKQVFNDKLFFNCPIQIHHFFVFEREAYLKTPGINPELKSAVDQDLYLKLLEVGDARFIKEVLYKYRLHSNGISQQKSKKSAKESFARVIYDSMKRRGIKKVDNKEVPSEYTNAEEIYDLLSYQTKPLHRLTNKIRLTLSSKFNPFYIYPAYFYLNMIAAA